MIPLVIRLRNFMCYKDNVPPLSLEGMKLVCLCGDNGNGKSALLDAMTWALWGKARGRTTDELVHTGQTDMEVDFEFAVAEQAYRVVRKHSKSRVNRPGYGSLDFQMRLLDQVQGDGYVSISGATIHETEANIKKILRTDYDTFINSAYLVQGRADEFTQKSPSKRKEILSDILGLSLYDSYEEMAKAARKDRADKRGDLERKIESDARKLEEMDSCRMEFEKVGAELVLIGQKIAAQEREIAVLETRKGLLEIKTGQLEELNRGLKEMEGELVSARNQVQAHGEKVRNFEKALAQEAGVEKGYAELLRLKQENEEWNEKLRLVLGLTQQMTRLEKHIGEVRSGLVAERNGLSQQIADLERSAAELPGLSESHQALQETMQALSGRNEELDRRRQLIVELESEIKNSGAMNAVLEGEIKDLKEKLEMLQQETARCPLCETELGLEGKARLDGNYKRQIQTKAEAHRRNVDEIQQKRKTLTSGRSEVLLAEQKLKAETLQKQKELAVIAGKMHRSEEARQQLVNRLERKKELETTLAASNFALAEQKRLSELTEEYKAVGYNQELHARVKESLKDYIKYEVLKNAVNEARAGLATEKALVARLENLIIEKTAAREEKTRSWRLLEEELRELPGVARQWQESKDCLAGLLRAKESAIERFGKLKEKLDNLKQLEKEKRRNEIDRQRLAEEEKIYSDLALYFGKKGIQAMLIETAIPEIEEEANTLLGRLTENRLSLKIETQKAKRTGTSVEETLEIKIADELGTRDYALFSGGEAFRINFALRLALSRLLARRAGAPLPTLIIDEGFGTQDREGRERLVEAIGSIRDDFEKIIVITHIEELKEAFPVRIEVTKGPEGSAFVVSG